MDVPRLACVVVTSTVLVAVASDAPLAFASPASSRPTGTHSRVTGKPRITTSAVPDGTVGVRYFAGLHTKDERAGAWSVSTGTLPPGIAIGRTLVWGSDFQRALIGTPTHRGTYAFGVKFTDAAGRSDVVRLSLHVATQSWRADATSGFNPRVACSGDTCYSAGTDYNDDGFSRPALEEKIGASGTWSSASLGGYTGWGSTTDIACGSDQTCALIGVDEETNDDYDPGDLPFVATRGPDGAWTAEHVATPSAIDPDEPSLLGAVSCEAERCLAVGEGNAFHPLGNSTAGLPLLDYYADGKWASSALSLAGTGLDRVALTTVTCVAGGGCTAAGVGSPDGHALRPVVVSINDDGSGATLTELAAPVGMVSPMTMLSSSCTSPTRCTILGAYGPGAYPGTPFFASLRNGAWSTVAFLAPHGAGQGSLRLRDLSCRTGGPCYAVGSASLGGSAQPVVARIGARVRVAFQTSFPGSEHDAGGLDSVACRDDGVCLAAGGYDIDGSLDETGLVITHLDAGDAPALQVPVEQSNDGYLHLEDLACSATCAGSGGNSGLGVLVTPLR